jgi:hypothetical protein
MKTVRVETTDGVLVELESEVWCNGVAGTNERPTPAKLLGVKANRDWPWIVWMKGGEVESSLEWAKAYSTRDAAIAADPMPEIAKLRAEIAYLKSKFGEPAE